jgi:AraC-like DNA-binding protein
MPLSLRIEEAKRLLESTQQPADDVSAAVGVVLSTVFKRRTGLTPGMGLPPGHPSISWAVTFRIDGCRCGEYLDA